MSMLALPAELVLLISQETQAQDRLALRATNRKLCVLVTPHAFRTVYTTSTGKSSAGFYSLLRCDDVRKHVREIVYRDSFAGDVGSGREDCRKDGLTDGPRDEVSDSSREDDGRGCLDEVEEGVIANLSAAFSLLHTLPALHTLTFAFHPIYKTHNTPISSFNRKRYPHVDIQLAIFAALESTSVARLRSLTLDHSTPFSHEISTHPTFLKYFRKLTHLHIATSSDLHFIFAGPLADFWARSLPPLLRAPASTLTSLTLHSEHDVGAIPGLTLGHLRYPHLTHLSLQHIVFDAGISTEAFILAHARTLTSLTLSRCKIAIPHPAPPTARRWADVCPRLAAKLVRLVHLAVDFEVGLDPDTFEHKRFPYALVQPGWGYSSVGIEEWVTEDDAALEVFQGAVAARMASVAES
ncbi:hypothetical protein BV25DRAFT_1913132 [Artomyces pyxidatus]|uniref:Uncharacterized protein n=1 Tax=Artomyces pyxidatus TaxID=48021 RepID=A0ACB8TC82_9AGAM|nr:hypothetical protein BV25DRAFT_1913132 [Artomyces pyxidatus]